MAKKSIKDSENNVLNRKMTYVKALETELADLDGAWRSFEKQIEEEMLHKGRDIELEAGQCGKSWHMGNHLFLLFQLLLLD